MSQALFAINPVIELCPIDRPREHVKAALQHEAAGPYRRLDGRPIGRPQCYGTATMYASQAR